MNYLIENCNEVALKGKEIRQACKDLYAKIKPRKEYENSFLEFRFGDYYKYLQEENLDKNRMKFYKLSHHIGCLLGALKLTKEDYYDME